MDNQQVVILNDGGRRLVAPSRPYEILLLFWDCIKGEIEAGKVMVEQITSSHDIMEESSQAVLKIRRIFEKLKEIALEKDPEVQHNLKKKDQKYLRAFYALRKTDNRRVRLNDDEKVATDEIYSAATFQEPNYVAKDFCDVLVKSCNFYNLVVAANVAITRDWDDALRFLSVDIKQTNEF
ncbi:OLC1v1030237C1 [Oldenlandia corymbosa var. corymbosa]|uniref:OLC1v1030237C1 n=1 Tax=Oldenlandia corymbosa var. corymbosa TaxID=529605 RepID=A0AAV1CH56_OLDCO|nr:OLC1v1030237C1 [Oldenlandia corymbosa var. corymbosa]